MATYSMTTTTTTHPRFVMKVEQRATRSVDGISQTDVPTAFRTREGVTTTGNEQRTISRTTVSSSPAHFAAAATTTLGKCFKTFHRQQTECL